MRNMSAQRMFERLALEHTPRCRFPGGPGADFAKWKDRTLGKVLACLGEFPDRVPANAEMTAEWSHDGILKQRWIIDVQRHLAASLLVNVPVGIHPGERRPAILCCHGHGPFGKEPVMGNDSSPELCAEIDRMHYNYGHVMAHAGYVTFSIDWIGFGERAESGKPNYNSQAGDQDWCNLYYLHATMLGTTPLAINVSHAKAAVDFVLGRPFVDASRLGVMGLSGGGTMALWMTLCDERFRATEIICYSDLWADFGYRQINYCGMQVAPGLYALVDLPDLQGLIAPRPLLVDIGTNDTCFMVDSAMACNRQLGRIYAAAGAPDKLWLDLFPGEHGWGANKSTEFFEKYL